MHLKLLVISHKPKFGSVMRFCGELSPEEKLILDSIIYRKYPHSTSDINEININNFHVYFMVFFGGKDEFGRDYRIVISSIFPFALSVREGQKLKTSFHKIKEDIEQNTFKSVNKYYADVRKRVNWSVIFPKKIKLNFFIFWGVNILILFLILASLAFFKPVRDFYHYTWINQYSILGRDNFKKYEMAKKFSKIQEENSKYWLNKAEDEAYFLINRYIRENPREYDKSIEKIDEYLNTKEYTLYRSEFIKTKEEILKNKRNSQN